MVIIVQTQSSFYRISEQERRCLETGPLNNAPGRRASVPGGSLEGYLLQGVITNGNLGDIRPLREMLFPTAEVSLYVPKPGAPHYQLLWTNDAENQTRLSSDIQRAVIQKSSRQNTLPDTPLSKLHSSSDTLPAIQAADDDEAPHD